ncbi:MAG: hypothetical protein V1846_03030 [Candidatus Komeilibacteria bacterium]
MKRIILIALLACLFVIPTFTTVCLAADQPAVNTTSTGLTPEDIAQLQKNVTAFAKVLGLADTTTAKSGTRLSMADVADKFLEYSKAAILATVGTIEKVAPHVWAVLVRQQYAKAFSSLAAPVFIFIFLLLFRLWVVRKRKSVTATENDVLVVVNGNLDPVEIKLTGLGQWANVLALLGMVTAALFVAARIAPAVRLLVNPEYYALRDLILLLLNKGQGM